MQGLARSEGQAAVEFVLILPVIVTLIFVLIQMGLTFNTYLRVTDAARVAARAAAVARFSGATNGAAACNVAKAAVSSDLQTSVSCRYPAGWTPAEPVEVTVTQPWKVELPLLPLSEKGTLVSKATDRLE